MWMPPAPLPLMNLASPAKACIGMVTGFGENQRSQVSSFSDSTLARWVSAATCRYDKNCSWKHEHMWLSVRRQINTATEKRKRCHVSPPSIPSFYSLSLSLSPSLSFSPSLPSLLSHSPSPPYNLLSISRCYHSPMPPWKPDIWQMPEPSGGPFANTNKVRWTNK